MPHLACWSCGRRIYTTVPIESLFAEERRCPRCGATLGTERRTTDRRAGQRRQDASVEAEPPDGQERRTDDRRQRQRRRDTSGG